jgi:hypothetical protein
MKLVLTFLCLLSFSFAQSGAQPAQPQPPPQGIPDGTRIFVTLNTTIDARKAAVGDPVKLEVTHGVRGADGKILIPAGAKLFGKVSVAVARSKQQPESQLSIVVQRALWKKGSADLNGFIAGGIDPPAGMRAPMEILVWGTQPSVADTTPPPPGTTIALPGEGNQRRTGLPDVDLRIASDPTIGSVLVSKKKDVVLESDTTFVIRHTVLKKP